MTAQGGGMSVTCPECEGMGYIGDGQYRCPTCRGKRHVTLSLSTVREVLRKVAQTYVSAEWVSELEPTVPYADADQRLGGNDA